MHRNSNYVAYLINGRVLYESEPSKCNKSKQVISAIEGKIDPEYFRDDFRKSVYRMIEGLAACFQSCPKNADCPEHDEDVELNAKVKKDGVIKTIVKFFKKKFGRASDYENINRIMTYSFKKCFYRFLYDYAGVDTINDLNDDDRSSFRKFMSQVNKLTKHVIEYYNDKFIKYKVAPNDIYEMLEVMTADDYVNLNLDDFVDGKGNVKN